MTWAHDAAVAHGAIAISLRTRQDSAWSTWKKVPYHPDEGPDPSSAEGRNATPGTDPIYVGEVDDVQVRAVTDSGVAPTGMKISARGPRQGSGPRSSARASTPGGSRLTAGDTDDTGDTDDVADTADAAADVTMAASVTRKPRIYSRKQWGADERMRDKRSLHYGEVHGGFVHHTVNANSYKRSQVPSIIRGIYAYHTQSRGWSDVGYNFLVDRFGRIWEGRAGGVGRPVVGAHTLGYNDDSFAMSAIGNFETRRPTSAMVRAYGRLFAWKLGLHGVRTGARVWITKRHFRAISGHRDAGQTACPGKYLYAKIPTIRRLASGQQRSFASAQAPCEHRGWPARGLRGAQQAEPPGVPRPHRCQREGRSGDAHRHLPSATPTGLISAGDWDGDGRARRHHPLPAHRAALPLPRQRPRPVRRPDQDVSTARSAA